MTVIKQIVLCIFLSCCFPSLLFGLEIRFKSEAIVSGPMLTLADVAELLPASEAGRLSGIELFPAPEAGEQKCFRSSTLKAYVAAAAVPADSIEWTGAETVCVRHDGVVVNPGEIGSIIDDRLRALLAHLSAQRVGFKIRNLPDPIALPPGRVEYDVLFSDPDVLESRHATVIIKVDGRVRENKVIAGQVEAFLPVVTAASELKRGDVIRPEDVRTEEKNIAGLRSPCLDPRTVIGKRLKRSVSPNQVLAKIDLDLPVLVERRQIVTMELAKGPLRISARGIASMEGKEGDVIMIKNLRSDREVPCEVIGPGMTRVVF